MKKLKKSIKAIIISICAVVVLAGSIVGAVLANKNKPQEENPNTANNVLVCNLTEEQKLLSNKINYSTGSGSVYNSKCDYSNFYFEDDSQIDFSLVEAFFENYFTYKTVYGKTIYLRSHETNGKIYFKEIFDVLDISQTLEFESVMEVNNNYAYAIYGYYDTDRYYAKRIVVDINDVTNVSIVKSLDYESNDIDEFKTQLVLNMSIMLNNGYFVNLEKGNNSLLNLQVYNYNGELLQEESGFISFDKREFEDNYFYYVIGNNVCVGSYVNGRFNVYTLEENNESLYNYTISQNYAFIEKISLDTSNSLNSVDGKIYEYTIIDMKTGDIQEIELEEGYVKATFSSENIDEFYFVYMQKPNQARNGFEENGLIVYYNADNEIVLKYSTHSEKDKVIHIANNTFVTKYSIYSAQNSVYPTKVKALGENSYFVDQNANNNTFIGFDGRIYYIYDIDGNKVFEKPMSLIYSYGNGIYFGFEQDELYFMNVNSKTISKITNFENDSELFNMMTIMYGGGYYFTDNSDDNKYSMYDYNQNLIYDNVLSFEIVDKNLSYVDVVLDGNKKVSIQLNSLVYVADGVVIEEDMGIEPYTDSSGDNWTSTGGTVDKSHSWGIVTASNGKYVSAGRMGWAGSAVVGAAFADSSVTFTYNYNTGVVSITDKYAVTGVTKNEASVNSSNETHSITIDCYFHYNVMGVQWDDHVGNLKGMEQITLDDVYTFLYDYILDSSKDFSEAHNTANYKENSSYETVRYGGSFTLSGSLTCIGGTLSGYSALVTSNPTFTASLSSGSNSLPNAKLYTSHKRVDWRTYAVYTPNTYTVSYDYAGGTKGSKNPTAFTYGIAGGSNDKEISNPSRLGYTFTGWSISNMSTNCNHYWGGADRGKNATASSVTSSTGFLNLRSTSGTVSFTATWSANTYSISYDLAGGSHGTNHPTSATYDAAFGLSLPSRTGYTFTGWTITNMSTDCIHVWANTNQGSASSTTGNKEVGFKNLRSTSGTVYFTATWSPNTYSIKYELDSGVTATGKTYPTTGTYDTQFKVDEPIRTGYTFTGWTLTNCGTASTHYYGSSSASTPFTTATLTNKKGPYFKNLRATSGTVTFTAVWTANNYTIEYDMNNPNDVTDDISEWSPDYPVYDETIYLNGTPTKTGYIFTHWNVSGMDENSSVTGDIVTHYHGVSASLLDDFTGTTLNDVTFPRYFKNLHSTGGIVTFTAQWEPITYDIEYDANGGVFNPGTNNPSSATYDAAFNVTTPVRHGYNFTYWDIEIVGVGGSSYDLDVNYPDVETESFINEATEQDSTVKFTAYWTPVIYNINFEYNNPTKANDSTTATFANWEYIPNPTRMGYLFDYWEIVDTSACGHTAECACFTSADLGQCSHYYNTAASDTSPEATRFTGESFASCTATYYKNLHCTEGQTVTFKAHWKKKTYKVINEASGDGSTLSTDLPKYDDVFYITAPTKAPTGFHFNGWRITSCNDKDEFTNETVTHYYGTTDNPTATFTGTTKTIANSVLYYFKNLSSNHHADESSTAAIVTISPVWAENTYTIAFDMNNPNRVTTDISTKASFTATYNTAYNITNPTKSGYTFEGWSLSGLTSDCVHYYGDSSSSMTAFNSDSNGAYKDTETTQYILLMNTYYKNLRSESGTAILKANWKALTYTITYHYIPETFNAADYNASQLFTHINIPKNMTSTITVQVVYDTYYTALDAKDELDVVVFAFPIGLKFKLWSISSVLCSDYVQVAKYNANNVVISNFSDSIMPNEKRMYGPGKDSDGELTWQHYPCDIHLYACYDLAGINLRYYAPETAAGKNDLSKYKNVPAINTNVKYTEFIHFAKYSSVTDGVNLMGWMISADYFSIGKLTEQSVTILDYNGDKYIAYQGAPCYWSYTNVDAYSYNDPTYFLYAVYSDDYSGSTHALEFTYRDNTSGSFGAMHSAKFYSVKGTDNTITTVKVPKIYNDGTNGWLPVELIDADGFKGYTELTSATWFNTMRRLDSYAFSGCTKLATFTLNEGLHTIGAYAFNGCTTITSISTPSSLRIIDGEAFNGCTNVSSLSLNTGLLTIGNYAFFNLSKVESLDLPSTLIGEIGDYAFCYIQMASVEIPKGVTTLGYGCFYQCTKLATITFADGSSLKTIEGSAFNRTVITTISIPNSVTSIGNYAFNSCSELASVTLPDSLTTLGDAVFYECSALTAVTIPKGLTSIPNYTFCGCAKLNSVTIYDGITSIGQIAFYNCSSLTTLTIPNSVTSIGKSALYGCSKLATLSVPFVGMTATTTTASEYIFGYIFGASSTTQASYVPTTLKTVHITNATKVDASAFNGLTMLTHLYINKGVTSIGQNAFNGCTGLVELSIPFVGTSSTDTTNCYLGYFFGQTSANATTSSVPSSLKTVHITNATFVADYAFYYAPVTTVNLNEGITEIKTYAFARSKITGITIPKSVTTIGGYAFYYATDLATANFNQGLTSMGDCAFQKTKLSSIVIPNSVTTIGAYTFAQIDTLSSVTLFDGLTTMGDNAFRETGIISIEIPKSLTVIPVSAFSNCSELSTVILHDSLTTISAASFYVTPKLTSITLPNSLTSIGNFAFELSGLTSIYIPDSVTSIGSEVFDGCESLTSVRLSNNITVIKYEAFMGTAITRIEIPASVTKIEYSAFKNCTALISVVCHGAVSSFEISQETPFAGCANIEYFYYGGNSETFYLNLSGYDETELFCDAHYQSIDFVYNYDHMQFTYHSNSYSLKAKGTIEANDYMIIPETYDDGAHGRYNVTEIEYVAFNGQSSMTYVYLPSGITSIGASAFNGCSALVTANIPSTVTYIGEKAFYNCSVITSKLTIPAAVVNIYGSTFYYCKKAGFEFASNSQCKNIGPYAFYYASYDATSANRYLMTIPNNVEYIGDLAFYTTRYMFNGELKLPSGLLYLGREAFYNCDNITMVELPRTLDSLNEKVFADCGSLKVVYIPDTIKSISARSYSLSPFYYAGPSYSSAPSLTLYLEGEGIPSGWGAYWNYTYSNKKANIFYNYPKMPNAFLSNLSTTYPMVQDSEGTFKVNLTSKLTTSTTYVGLQIASSYYVVVHFEYMVYSSDSKVRMQVYRTGGGIDNPVDTYESQSVSYQYYSQLLGPDQTIDIRLNNYSASTYSCGMYIKNLRIDPIERFGDYDFSYTSSGSLEFLRSTNQQQESGPAVSYANLTHYSASGFTYYATDYCELTLGYRSNGETNFDFLRGVLNHTTEVFTSKGYPSENTFTTFTYLLNPGDTMTIYYRKDSNGKGGDDTGYIRNFYIAKLSEYYYEPVNAATVTNSTGTMAYKNAEVSTTYDIISQWTSLNLTTAANSWEILYKTIYVKKHNATMKFALYASDSGSSEHEPLNHVIEDQKIIGPFMTVSVSVPDSTRDPALSTYAAYGCFLPNKFRVSVLTITIPSPGFYYLALNFGGYADNQNIYVDFSCIESIGVESYSHSWYDPGFDNWENSTALGAAIITKTYIPNNYSSYVNDGDQFWRSGNTKRGSSTSTTQYVAPADGLVTFDYFMESEVGYDVFYLYLNNDFIMSRSGYTNGNYAVSMNKGDKLKFIYKKDSSSDAGIDAIEIRNFRFKRCSVFKYDDGYYVPSNIGLQNSESVMVLHPGLSNQTWDYHEYSNNYISGYYYVDIQMAHELIHDWFEIYDQWGDVVYSTKDKTVGSDTFSYYFNEYYNGVSCSDFLIVKFHKDGSINSTSTPVSIYTYSDMYTND